MREAFGDDHRGDQVHLHAAVLLGHDDRRQAQFADLRSTPTATPGSWCWIALQVAALLPSRQNSSVVRAMARCSSVKSSGVKISAGVRILDQKRAALDFGAVRSEHGHLLYILSKIPAAPWPPPMHMVTMP